jgi:HTH-type transcriptional regulator, sugar sensing transcriptional regulator
MFEKLLQDIGLSDKEANLYLALLGFDTASVADLSLKTKIKRPTVYVVMQQLLKKGLISESTVGRSVQYKAEPPERLETFIERQILNLNDKKDVVAEHLSELKALHKESGERPVVRFYDGKEGVLNAGEEIFSEIDDKEPFVYMIYPKDAVKKYFSEAELKDVRNKRLKYDIKARAIFTSQGEEKGESDNYSQRVRLDSKKYPILNDITVYKDGVWVSIFGKRISGIVIRNADVANSMRSLLKFVFDTLK